MSSAKKKPLAEADKEMKRAKKKDTFKPEMKPGKHMTGKTSGPPPGFSNAVVSEKENESVYVPPMPRPTMVAKKEEVTNQRLQRIHECIMKEHFEFSEPNVDRIIEVTSKNDPKNMCRPYLEQIDELRSHCRPRSYHRVNMAH
ncbi:hypothetical protein HDE_04620 [Halotydeus destructor]|nr:hypothetical protein HDE_04620 [Halotydeus destructor]